MGTGTTALVFRYTAAAAARDTDTDGVAVKVNSLALNSGTMTDEAGNALTLTHSAKDGGTSHVVDAIPPYLNHHGVSLVSTGPYGIGDHIDWSVSFTEPVNVTSDVILSGIEVAGLKTYASYNRGSGTNAPIFRFTVTSATDGDADGVSVGTYGVYNGTVRDLAGNDVVVRGGVGNIAPHTSHRVDTGVPTVLSLAFTSTGPYKAGSNIDVTLTTSEAVNVTGTPQLTLVIGTAEKTANYNSGSGTTTLVFRYTVAAGDTDTDGVSVKANSLALNEGTLEDEAGNALTRTHSAKDGGNGHRVDTTAPTVSSLAFTSTGPYKVGSNIDVTVTTSENVTVDATNGKPSLTLVVGTTEKTANYNSGTGDDIARFPIHCRRRRHGYRRGRRESQLPGTQQRHTEGQRWQRFDAHT